MEEGEETLERFDFTVFYTLIYTNMYMLPCPH